MWTESRSRQQRKIKPENTLLEKTIYTTLDMSSLNTKLITVIPIIKDEGGDSSNNDRINFITYSWMNLLNIFVILGYYSNAEKQHRREGNYITNQTFDNDYIISKINEITEYRMSALHWNTSHFENDFNDVYKNAVESYREISESENIIMHSFDRHQKILESFNEENTFSIEKFKVNTLSRSLQAAIRETKTNHQLEFCDDGEKAIFNLQNNLGGVYHLTTDELFYDSENKVYIIQESKNSTTNKLPAVDDIKDGLFKLILYANIHTLKFDGEAVNYRVRLKLTGALLSTLKLPCDDQILSEFIEKNEFNYRQIDTLKALNLESQNNNLEIILGPR